jgi:D-sedoheptulose 7-phosphate isomerase
MKNTIKHEINAHIDLVNSLHDLNKLILQCAQLCIDCINNGGKILLFGNGGSASDAQHIAAELVGRYKIDRKSLSALALNTDTSIITSISNDFGYEHVFARQIEGLAKNGDIAIGISTSGKSKNVTNALKIASKLNCKTIGLTGNYDVEMKKNCDINIAIASNDTARIQEMHILIGHIICQLIDQECS